MGRNLVARALDGAGDRAAWEALWNRAKSPWLAQHPAYLEAVADGAGNRCAVGVFHGGELLAAVPFLIHERRGSTNWFQPVPAPFAGPLVEDDSIATDESAWNEIGAAIAGAVRDCTRARIVLPPGWIDVRPLVWREGWRAFPHYSYVSRWESPERFEAELGSAARRQLAKARREGLRMEVLDSLAPLRALREGTAQRQSFEEIVSWGGYERLLRWGSDGSAPSTVGAMALGVFDSAGALHAGALFARDFGRTYYLLGASAPAKLGSGAPTLLHVEAVRRFAERNWPRVHDWCGANIESVAQFKRGFGPSLELTFLCEFRGTGARLLDALRGRR